MAISFGLAASRAVVCSEATGHTAVVAPKKSTARRRQRVPSRKPPELATCRFSFSAWIFPARREEESGAEAAHSVARNWLGDMPASFRKTLLNWGMEPNPEAKAT